MVFFPLTLSTDSRAAKGVTPLLLRNCYVEAQPEGVGKRAPYLIRPTFGMTARVTPSASKLLRGLFCRPGVVGGRLFAVLGTTLYSIDEAWSATSLGAIPGSGRVLMDSLGANLLILSSGVLYQWDGSSLTTVSDPDFPSDAFTLAVLGDRVLTSAMESDTFDWSAVGDASDWPSTGFAASARYPDPIKAQIELGGDLWHFGANSAQPWRAVGGTDEEAFDTLSTAVLNRGIAGRDAIAKLDSGAMWVGDDRVVYDLQGYGFVRVVNRDVEAALLDLDEGETANIRCFSFANGSHLTWAMRLPNGRAFFYDRLIERWYERTAFGTDGFSITHYARFNGQHIVGSDTSGTLYTWDESAYSDAGASIERVVMVHIPAQGRTPISNITLDIKTFGQPLEGQGSDPEAMVTVYRDGGTLDSLQQIGVERTVKLGRAGQYGKRPTLWRLGAAGTVDGLLLKVRITDPVGFAFSGVFVNEVPS